MKRHRFARTSIQTVAAAAALGIVLVSLPAATGYARGAGAQAGGQSMEHMSPKGQSNTSGPAASDPDTGLGRAEERASDKGLEHGKSFDQPGNPSPSGNADSHKQLGKKPGKQAD